MSRGLGRHQRDIKRFIKEQDERFRQHCDAVGDNYDGSGPEFWTTWTEIRLSLFEYLKSNNLIWGPDDPTWLARERAAKRALHTLCKRGEIGRIRDNPSGLYWYMPAKTYNEGFSPKAMADLKEALEKLS